jgi:hypothetical protein
VSYGQQSADVFVAFGIATHVGIKAAPASALSQRKACGVSWKPEQLSSSDDCRAHAGALSCAG